MSVTEDSLIYNKRLRLLLETDRKTIKEGTLVGIPELIDILINAITTVDDGELTNYARTVFKKCCLYIPSIIIWVKYLYFPSRAPSL